jgi:hypothetical protein
VIRGIPTALFGNHLVAVVVVCLRRAPSTEFANPPAQTGQKLQTSDIGAVCSW